MNKAILIGRLTKDPELRTTPTGRNVCQFSVAVSRNFTNANGEREADFINCVAFGKTGETIAQYITKGRQIAVTGSIRTGSYDGQDGVKRYTTDVIVESFEFIGSSNNNSSNNSWNPPVDDGIGFGQEVPIDDGDMPF